MRFQVSQVMDAIEQRLTTDIAGAQAVVDLGQVIRHVPLDRGRPVNLVRVGMTVDALGRYLVDDGAMLYGVVDRGLLSEQALTSKERMVLGRWADDGQIEVTETVGDRPVEIAGITGLPLIALRPMPELLPRYGWLADGAGRVLWLAQRFGVATLRPMDDPASAPPEDPDDRGSPAVVLARAKVPPRARVPSQRAAAEESASDPAGEPEQVGESPTDPATTPGADETESAVTAESEVAAEVAVADSGTAVAAAAEQPAGGSVAVESPAAADQAAAADPGAESDPEPAQDQASAEPAELPAPVQVFGARGATPTTVTRVSWRRFLRSDPDPAHQALLTRRWRCDGFDCPVFGEHRRIGQPVPRLRDGRPHCPRHDQPVIDIGPRPAAYPIAIVIDDIPRRRLVVRQGQPLTVGREATDPEHGQVSVAEWLHSAAATWISPAHLILTADTDGLTVTDQSRNGTVVWQRKGPDDPGTTLSLRGGSHLLGEWDSVELYTGVELIHGDRRRAATLTRQAWTSVLVDAPTAAYHQLDR